MLCRYEKHSLSKNHYPNLIKKLLKGNLETTLFGQQVKSKVKGQSWLIK